MYPQGAAAAPRLRALPCPAPAPHAPTISTHTDCSLPMHTEATSRASAANRKASAPLRGTEQKLKLSAGDRAARGAQASTCQQRMAPPRTQVCLAKRILSLHEAGTDAVQTPDVTHALTLCIDAVAVRDILVEAPALIVVGRECLVVPLAL